ncbi:hypothetical protein KPH14_001381 [Odynerus spinipes]|uniref:Uncharacterized protein n=1 Tax=Odynerus spinipes TaxID=1348599 RepID=A0AAD9VLL2_9HYME|nr:hypothetical protein KPH14_001381 [Odynerus spinipes]
MKTMSKKRKSQTAYGLFRIPVHQGIQAHCCLRRQSSYPSFIITDQMKNLYCSVPDNWKIGEAQTDE